MILTCNIPTLIFQKVFIKMNQIKSLCHIFDVHIPLAIVIGQRIAFTT